MVLFKNILVPVDFGESSRDALTLAIDLAKQYGSALTLLHAVDVPAYGYGAVGFAAVDILTPMQEAARAHLDTLLAEVRKERPETTGIVATGVPWREIIAAIDERKPDLIVMGTHGRRGIGRAILGSVAEKVVRLSLAPVLTVRGKEDR